MTPTAIAPRITWLARTLALDRCLDRPSGGVHLTHRSTGREGEIWEVRRRDRPVAVIKRWTTCAGLPAHGQFRLLRQAARCGVSVPEPLGWGVDEQGREVLATHFAGDPLTRAREVQLRDLATLLARVHATPVDGDSCSLPRDGTGIDDLLTRAFPDLEGQSDVATILAELRRTLTSHAPRLTHGDIHLGNVVADRGRLSLVDWSDARIGDARYDLAWAAVLLLLYHGWAAYAAFRQAYLDRAPFRIDPQELRRFELIAALRWLVLARRAPVPIEPEKLATARRFVRERLPAGLGDVFPD